MSLKSGVSLIPSLLDRDQPVLSRDVVEQRIGSKLPDIYVDLLAPDYHAVMFKEGVRIRPIASNPLSAQSGFQSVLTLFGLSEGDHGIVANYQRLQGRLESQFIPIAEDGLGNLFMFDCTTLNVVFWHHECIEGENSEQAYSLVSEDVASFIAGLEVSPEDKVTDTSSVVKRATFNF